MILRLINILSISMILPMLVIYPCPYGYSNQRPSSHRTNFDLALPPDSGSLSNFDNISDISFQGLKGGQKPGFELYVYTLALRLNAIRNILAVTKITRGLGEHLGIPDQKLRGLPGQIFQSFGRERFVDLHKTTDSIRSGDFDISKEVFDEAICALSKKSETILSVKKKMLEKDILERKNIKDEYTEKIPAEISIPLYLPYGSPYFLVYARDLKIPLGFRKGNRIIGINRTRELKGHDRETESLEKQIAKSAQILDSITGDLYLYLPFYERNLLQKTWSSVRGNLKPSYAFADLLVATVFFDLRPDTNVKTPCRVSEMAELGHQRSGRVR